MEYLLRPFGLFKPAFESSFDYLVKVGQHLKDHLIPHERNSYQPHVLHHRTIGLFSFLLVTVKITAIVATTFLVPEPAFSAAITQENIFSLTNESRKSFDLPALSYSSVLEKAAQAKADDMLAKGYFAHTSPDGKSPWEFIKDAGYSYITAGENLAWGFPQDCAECVEEAWMNSPGHKANIVNKYFEQIGIGISQGVYEGHASTFVVQMFGTPVSQQISLKNEPTKLVPETKVQPEPVSQTSETQVTKTEEVKLPLYQPQLEEQSGEELKFLKTSAKVQDSVVSVEANTSSSASKVLVMFGGKSVLMKPVGESNWKALLPLGMVENSAVMVVAYDISGNKVSEQVANFSSSLQESFDVTGDVQGDTITVFGKSFSPKVAEKQFYLIFVAGILSCLAIAIAVRKHIQHVHMVANSAFVAIFAMLLWLG